MDRLCEKWAGVFPAAVACPSMAKSDENAAVEHLDLVDEVFIYLTESRYVDGCSAVCKRAIRKKAKMFSVRDGVMYFLRMARWAEAPVFNLA